MIVICNGMPRSASTWSFNVTRMLLQDSSLGADIHAGYDENIGRFIAAARATADHIIVKCHGLDAAGRSLALENKARVIYTWRDPADAVVSCMRMFRYDFEQGMAAIDASLAIYDFHRNTGSAVILEYSEILSSPILAIQRIASHLHLGDISGAIPAIVDQLSLESVRRRPARNAHNGDYDPETLFHPNHIRDGGVGYGRAELNAYQIEQIDTLLAKYNLMALEPTQERSGRTLDGQP